MMTETELLFLKHNKKRSNKSNNRVEENKDCFTVNNSKKQNHLAFQHLAGVQFFSWEQTSDFVTFKSDLKFFLLLLRRQAGETVAAPPHHI